MASVARSARIADELEFAAPLPPELDELSASERHALLATPPGGMDHAA